VRLKAWLACSKLTLFTRRSTTSWTTDSKHLFWAEFFFHGFSQCGVIVAHGALKTANGANVALTTTVLFIASMPIITKLPVRSATVTVSLCLGARFSRLAI